MQPADIKPEDALHQAKTIPYAPSIIYTKGTSGRELLRSDLRPETPKRSKRSFVCFGGPRRSERPASPELNDWRSGPSGQPQHVT